MSIEDWFPDYDYWDCEYEQEIKCKYCGEFPLYWEKDTVGWYLLDEDGERHDCRTVTDEDWE